jgi:vanillate/3-O-methylgallate O-demethylase
VSLAGSDREYAEPGAELIVLWGEEPHSAKPQVEPHQQFAIRASVASVPDSQFARTNCRQAIWPADAKT